MYNDFPLLIMRYLTMQKDQARREGNSRKASKQAWSWDYPLFLNPPSLLPHAVCSGPFNSSTQKFLSPPSSSIPSLMVSSPSELSPVFTSYIPCTRSMWMLILMNEFDHSGRSCMLEITILVGSLKPSYVELV